MLLRTAPLWIALLATANGLGQQVLYVPQVVDGENAPDDRERFFATDFTFVNLSATSDADVTLTLTADDGTAFPRLSGPGLGTGAVAAFRLPPLGTRSIQTSNGPFPIVGWARIETDGRIGVVVTLQLLGSGSAGVVTSTSLIPQPTAERFSTAAFVSPSAATGLALLNPSTVDSAEVRIDLFNAAGILVDSRAIVLDPLEKIAQFFDEGELFTSLDEAFFGTAEISSGLPLAATVIRVDDTYWSAFPVFGGRDRD